jgi:hypothetical protein
MGDQPDDDWRADFASAEQRRLEASLSVSVSERLRWLEEALAFAARVGALPRRDARSDQGSQTRQGT